MKSLRTTNAKCREFVKARIDFQANNLKGVNEKGCYVVYSYDWYPLFVWHAVFNKWYACKDKYSPSTSKQYGQAHPQENMIMLSHEGMKQMVFKANDWWSFVVERSFPELAKTS